MSIKQNEVTRYLDTILPESLTQNKDIENLINMIKLVVAEAREDIDTLQRNFSVNTCDNDNLYLFSRIFNFILAKEIPIGQQRLAIKNFAGVIKMIGTPDVLELYSNLFGFTSAGFYRGLSIPSRVYVYGEDFDGTDPLIFPTTGYVYEPGDIVVYSDRPDIITPEVFQSLRPAGRALIAYSSLDNSTDATFHSYDFQFYTDTIINQEERIDNTDEQSNERHRLRVWDKDFTQDIDEEFDTLDKEELSNDKNETGQLTTHMASSFRLKNALVSTSSTLETSLPKGQDIILTFPEFKSGTAKVQAFSSNLTDPIGTYEITIDNSVGKTDTNNIDEYTPITIFNNGNTRNLFVYKEIDYTTKKKKQGTHPVLYQYAPEKTEQQILLDNNYSDIFISDHLILAIIDNKIYKVDLRTTPLDGNNIIPQNHTRVFEKNIKGTIINATQTPNKEVIVQTQESITQGLRTFTRNTVLTIGNTFSTISNKYNISTDLFPDRVFTYDNHREILANSNGAVIYDTVNKTHVPFNTGTNSPLQDYHALDTGEIITLTGTGSIYQLEITGNNQTTSTQIEANTRTVNDNNKLSVEKYINGKTLIITADTLILVGDTDTINTNYKKLIGTKFSKLLGYAMSVRDRLVLFYEGVDTKTYKTEVAEREDILLARYTKEIENADPIKEVEIHRT